MKLIKVNDFFKNKLNYTCTKHEKIISIEVKVKQQLDISILNEVKYKT